MGEAIITARIGDSVVRAKWKYKTEVITTNTIWEVPSSIDLNKGISVRIFGGGGGAAGQCGGGGGWMNNTIFTNLNIEDKIDIKIGAGGLSTKTGGTTSFGNYLSANGGTSEIKQSGSQNLCNGGSGGSGGGGGYAATSTAQGFGGTGYQFGGGGGGGNGGKWGGGGGGGKSTAYSNLNGGNGGYYGGGGGGYSTLTNGGQGGEYGGGGGSGSYQHVSKGGNYGGNGASITLSEDYKSKYKAATAGINTSTWTNVFNDGNDYFRGKGLAGVSNADVSVINYGSWSSVNPGSNCIAGGGGGFGSRQKGGCIREDDWNSSSNIIGYSGLGGNSSGHTGNNGTDTSTWTNVFYDGNEYFRGQGLPGQSQLPGGGGFGGCGGWESGGGGGYGSNGGSNYGGGGGFGGDGGRFNGGGGGYGRSAIGGYNAGGGGGYYARGGDGILVLHREGTSTFNLFQAGGGGGYGGANFGGGGGGHDMNGMPGICIIQYYVKE